MKPYTSIVGFNLQLLRQTEEDNALKSWLSQLVDELINAFKS